MEAKLDALLESVRKTCEVAIMDEIERHRAVNMEACRRQTGEQRGIDDWRIPVTGNALGDQGAVAP